MPPYICQQRLIEWFYCMLFRVSFEDISFLERRQDNRAGTLRSFHGAYGLKLSGERSLSCMHNLVSHGTSVRAFAPQAESWAFESQPWQTLVVKTGSDSSTVKQSAIGVSVTGPRRWPLETDAPCHSRQVWLAKEPSLLKAHECRA